MANIIIATPALSDAATVTSNPTATTAGPVTNLQKMQPTDLCEVESTSPYFDINLGSVVDFNFIALLHSSASTSSFWTLVGSDTQGGLSSPDWTSGATSTSYIGPNGHLWYLDSTTRTNQWIRISMLNVTNPFTAGRLIVADVFQPSVNYQYGVADGYQDDSTISVTSGGNLIPTQGGNRAVLDLTLNILTEAERHAIRELNRTVGATGDVCVITDPAATSNKEDYVYHGLLQARRQAIQTRYNWHNITYNLQAL